MFDQNFLVADAVKMLDLLKQAERPVKTHYVYPMLVQLAEKEDIDGSFLFSLKRVQKVK